MLCGTREVWRRLGIWRQGCAITPLPASQYSRQSPPYLDAVGSSCGPWTGRAKMANAEGENEKRPREKKGLTVSASPLGFWPEQRRMAVSAARLRAGMARNGEVSFNPCFGRYQARSRQAGVWPFRIESGRRWGGEGVGRVFSEKGENQADPTRMG